MHRLTFLIFPPHPPIPQLWFRRQAALAPSQFWIRLPCHYLVVAPTRVLCVGLSGASLPASRALQTGATHHRRPWSVDLLQLWQLCARMELAGNVHFLLMFAHAECTCTVLLRILVICTLEIKKQTKQKTFNWIFVKSLNSKCNKRCELLLNL